MNKPLSVIGAGAWGTALAIQAARAGNQVSLWARDPTAFASRESPRLPGIPLPDRVTVVATPPDDAAATLLCVPVAHLRETITRLRPAGAILVCAKGLEAETLALPHEILAELRPGSPVAILSGPNFAREIAIGLPAAAVIASEDAALRNELIGCLGSPAFRLYGNDDPLGVELGGAAKNVIAIAAGALIGAGLGENARAALVTRGIAELARLVAGLGGRRETAYGLSGLGDLLLTCTGPSSRNFSLGFALGKGMSLADVLHARTTATEGVATAPALVSRAAEIDLPICQEVARLVTGQTTLDAAIKALMSRPLKDE
jgi:glycerol-3-phosphate dehydrogenase (NAD(P)+)